jgi:glycine C-acetyltransferase
MVFCLHSGKTFLRIDITMSKRRKTFNDATKLATENGGGIFIHYRRCFGMRGQQGKLERVVAMKQKWCSLLVDDAHGFGTLGKTGAGAGENREFRMI